jgi:hypothetical protein
MDDDTTQIFKKYYGKNYKKALKKNNLERKRLKNTFFGKYPYADASRFEFEVTIGKDLSVAERTVFFKVDDTTSYDVSSSTFKNNVEWGKYLTGEYTVGSWPEKWLLITPYSLPVFRHHLIYPNNPDMRLYKDGTSSINDVRFQEPVELGYEIHDFDIYVTDTRKFRMTMPPIRAVWKGEDRKLTSYKDSDIRKVDIDYLNDPYFTMICAAYVATFMCGISVKHLIPDPSTPKQITSLARYHLYYSIRKFMFDPSRLDEYAPSFLGPVKKYLLVRHGNIFPTNMPDIIKTTVNLSDRDYLSFIPYGSGGLTKLGQSLLQESIECLTYSILGAQATTRWAIEGAGAKSTQTQSKFHDIIEDTIRQKDPAVTIGNMRTAIDDNNVRLDLAVSPGVILMPSNMIILEKGVVGFNNILTIASTDTMSFGKNDVNERRTSPSTSTTSPDRKGPASPDPVSGDQKDSKTSKTSETSKTPKTSETSKTPETPKTSPLAPNASLGSVVILPATAVLGILIARYIL